MLSYSVMTQSTFFGLDAIINDFINIHHIEFCDNLKLDKLLKTIVCGFHNNS